MNLKGILESAGEGLEPRGPIHVLVDLNTPDADPACLVRLEAHGLAVDQVIGNKVLGTIEGDSLETLRRDPDVAEVEISARLRPHQV